MAQRRTDQVVLLTLKVSFLSEETVEIFDISRERRWPQIIDNHTEMGGTADFRHDRELSRTGGVRFIWC